VLNDETEAPIERANVLLKNGDETRGTSTDASGRFQMTPEPGEYTVEVSALGYRETRRTVTLRAGKTTSVTLTLPPREYSLNEIVVADQRRQTETSATTVQRIDEAALETQDAADVSELAELVPATHVQTNSRGQTILYFRNAGDRQVGQFFDGALLNIPWDNRVNISLIPASVVEEMTVTKGIPSVRYGSNVIGGAINFQSRTLDSEGQQTELKGALGTAEQRRASVTHLGRTQKWDYTAAVQYTSRGNQPLPHSANLDHNQPLEDRRVNTDRELISGFGRASYRLENGGQLGLSVLHVDAEQGVAPAGNEAKPGDTRYWQYPLWQKSTVIASGQKTIGQNTSVQGAAWGSRFAQDIADYRTIAYDTLNQTQEGRDLTGGARLIGTQNLPFGTLTLALNGLTSRHEKSTASSDSVTTFRQHIFSAGLEYEAQVDPQVEVSGGINLDGADYPQTGPFPKRDPFYAWGLTTGLRVDMTKGWTLRGAAGRKNRFPTMRELFGAAIGKFVPNPNLEPISAWIGEVGVEHRSQHWYFGSTAFFNRVQNTIDKCTISQNDPVAECSVNEAGELQSDDIGKVRRINLKGARVYGLETTVRWTPTEAFVLDGNVTWSHPRGLTEDGDTQRLDEKPSWLGTGRMSYNFPFGLSFMGQVRYTGGIYARNQQDEFVPLSSSPSLVLDGRLGYDLSQVTDLVSGSVYVRGDNLTDEAVFIGLGLPRPGRSFRVGLDIAL